MDGDVKRGGLRLRPWPRFRICGSLIQVSTGRCVTRDPPPGPVWPLDRQGHAETGDGTKPGADPENVRTLGI